MASGRGTSDDRQTRRLLKTDFSKRRVHSPRSGAEQRSDGKQVTDKLVGSNAALFARVASFPKIFRWYHASMYPEKQRPIVGFSLPLSFDVVYPIPWYTFREGHGVCQGSNLTLLFNLDGHPFSAWRTKVKTTPETTDDIVETWRFD